jgi:antirestriction protein ArdC
MKSIQQFEALNGCKVYRNELEKIIETAKAENNTDIIYRLAKVLNEKTKVDYFEIEVEKYPKALNAPKLIVKYSEALDESGKLRKGYKYENGTVLKEIDNVPLSFLTGLEYQYEPIENIGLGKSVSSSEIYDMITDRMLNLIKEANKGDYKRAWKEEGYLVPYNFISKKQYRGVNSFMLTPLFGMLDNPYFLTFKQIQELGGKLKKGSHGYKVVYFSSYDKKYSEEEITKINSIVENIDGAKMAQKGDSSHIFFMKYYNVFNGSDIEGINFDLDNFKLLGKVVANDEINGKENKEIDLAEAIISNYPNPQPKILFQGSRAFYRPSTDVVTVPKLIDFDSSQSYYRTLLHELSHSTGHESRLNRDFSGEFGSKEYAFEELVAEFGAVFLSAQAGIMFYTNKNHAGYLKGWNEVLVPQLKNDNKFLMKASSQSQKLADFVLQPDSKGEFLFMKKNHAQTPKKPSNKVAKTDVKSKNPIAKTSSNLPKVVVKKVVKPTIKNPKVENKVEPLKVDETTKQISLFGGLNGYIQTEILRVKDTFKTKTNTEIKKILNDSFIDFKDLKIENLETKKTITITKAVRQKTIFTGVGLTSELATAILYLPHLVAYGKLVNTTAPKANHIKKYKAVELYNFESKINIDGITKYFILTAFKNNKGHLLYYVQSSDIKKSSRIPNSKNFKSKSVFPKGLDHKDIKKTIPTTKKPLKGIVDSLSINMDANSLTGVEPVSDNPKVKKIGSSSNSSSEFFTVAGEVGEFLQQVEKKPVESVVITLDGSQGAGKTTTVYKFMDAFAAPGNKCLFISAEEHPESHLAIDKANKLLSDKAKQNIDIIGEVSNVEELYKVVAPYDIVFVDSWQKLQRMVGNIRLDEDLRKKFNGKVFVVIFQQTTTGRTKGGAEVVFDGDIIIKMVKCDSFADNYAYFDKNRYTKVPIETIRYNIANGIVYNPQEPKQDDNQEVINPLNLSFQVN